MYFSDEVPVNSLDKGSEGILLENTRCTSCFCFCLSFCREIIREFYIDIWSKNSPVQKVNSKMAEIDFQQQELYQNFVFLL